jgi:hypothetical protein
MAPRSPGSPSLRSRGGRPYFSPERLEDVKRESQPCGAVYLHKVPPMPPPSFEPAPSSATLPCPQVPERHFSGGAVRPCDKAIDGGKAAFYEVLRSL